MKLVVATVVAVAVSATAAAPQPRLSVAFSPRPGSIEMGAPWQATLTVRSGGKAYTGARPRIETRLGSDSRSFATTRARAGVYRARIALTRPGRWRLGVRVAGRSVAAGALTVVPGLTNAMDADVLPDGSLLVGDFANYVLRARPGERPSIAAGNGALGSGGDGGPATAARVGFPVEVASDPRGGFTIVSDERRVRRVAPDGTISTLAELDQPTSHAHDRTGNVYVSELGGRVRRIDAATGAVTTVAEGLDRPHGLLVDVDGTLVVCETFANRVVRVDPATGRVTPFAGGLTQPVDVARASDGSFFVAAAEGVVRIASAGGIANVTPALRPNSVAIDAAGLVYFTELRRPRVRLLDPATGTVTTVLGRDT